MSINGFAAAGLTWTSAAAKTGVVMASGCASPNAFPKTTKQIAPSGLIMFEPPF